MKPSPKPHPTLQSDKELMDGLKNMPDNGGYSKLRWKDPRQTLIDKEVAKIVSFINRRLDMRWYNLRWRFAYWLLGAKYMKDVRKKK